MAPLAQEQEIMGTASTALITGASRGLGLALAEEWLKRDARVIATQRSVSRELGAPQSRHTGGLEVETVNIARTLPSALCADASPADGSICSSRCSLHH